MLQQANQCLQAGRLPEAQQLYQTVLQAWPQSAEANHNFGMLKVQLADFNIGLAHLKAAVEADPAKGQHWLSYAHALHLAGHQQDALNVIRVAIERGLNTPVALSLKRDVEAALARAPVAPKEPAPQECDQLETLLGMGRHVELEQQVRRLLECCPESGYLWGVLGFSLLVQGKDAVEALTKATALSPDDAPGRNNLGNALQLGGQLKAALVHFQRAVQIRPDFADAHNNLGNALRDLGQMSEAADSYRRALAVHSSFAEAHNNLGNVLRGMGQLDAALASIHRALTIKPNHATGHNNLGYILMDLGRYEGAIGCFQRALELKPDYFEACSNQLFAQHLLPEAASMDMLNLAQKYGALVQQGVPQYTDWDIMTDPDKILRVGLVSGDLRSHPVGHFVEGILQALSGGTARRLELVAYSSHFLHDALSDRIKACCHGWHAVAGLSDEALAQQIAGDQIDILIDLCGHTAHNRLPVFARKPAPVQATWLGYFATTGVAAIDYLIADPWTVPQGDEAQFTETIWRLPQTRLCFTPPDIEVEVSALPALTNGFVTFGCFNNLSKMHDGVVALWAEILARVPGSRLFLKAKQLREDSVQQSVVNRFGRHGIQPDRLILEGSEPRAAYLAAYQRVDIALDPFPYPGGATSVEALWMGVPVLTLAGQRFLSRQGVGLLVNAGLSDWVAADRGDYLARAIRLSSDLIGLSALRQDMRPQLRQSPLFDATRFAGHFEVALRGMWARYCAARNAPTA